MLAVTKRQVVVVREVGMGGLSYDETGAGEPALLFLHGWCGDRSFFAPEFEHFSRSHRVVSVDLPGHGQSAIPDEYTIEAFAGDVAELAGALRLGRCVVFGHSIGAMVALALSQLAPEHVRAVALIDPPPLSKEVWEGFAPQLIASFSGPDGPTGRRQFVEQMFLPTDDAARRTRIIATMTAVPNDMAVLRQCEVPVVTISSAVPTNDAASLLAANSAMTFGQAVGAGHFLQLEVPEQVNPMIERFLAIIPALEAPGDH
jgi:pimeloyl-ACP methyl ester carboxylesterase